MILNSNIEKGRSCWKTFFTKKSCEEKLKCHRNRKGTRHGKLQESKNIYLDEKTEHFRIRRTQYTIWTKIKTSAAIERHRYYYNVMFLCIWNCCSNVECYSNEEGRNGRNIWNVCYSFNIYIYIYIYTYIIKTITSYPYA